MDIDNYAEWTDKVWKSGKRSADMDDKDLSIVALGMAGETGEALEYVKKYLRDQKDFRAIHRLTTEFTKQDERSLEFAKEMGDILFYWVRLCKWAGWEPSEVIELNVEKLEKRHAERIAKRA